MGRWLANVILFLVIVMVFSAVAMADYYLRSEATGKTRRALAADGVELNLSSVMRAAAENEMEVLNLLEEMGSASSLKWDWGAVGAVAAGILESQTEGEKHELELWSREMTPLMVAVVAGSDEAVDFLLVQEAVRSALGVRRPGDELSVLDLALRARDFESARKLIVAGAKWVGGGLGGSHLLRAVKGDDVVLFDFLMEQKQVDDAGEVALRWAVREDKLAWVRRLCSVAEVLNLKAVGEEDGENLWTEVYRSGQDEMLALLLELGVGAGLHTRNAARSSLMMLALESALGKAVDERGAELDNEVEKKRGRDWLELWLRAGALPVFEGEDEKARRSLVDRLIESGDSELIGAMVRSMGEEVPDAWMLKALDLALSSGERKTKSDDDERLRVLRFLFRLGGNVEAGRGDAAAGGRLLRRAVVARDGRLVRWLLQSGADSEGELWRVLGDGDAQMLKLLLQHGADANESLAIGVGSPLSLCLRKRRYDLARLLLDHGAEVDTASNEGLSLLEQAVSRGDIRAATLLREYGKQGGGE